MIIMPYNEILLINPPNIDAMGLIKKGADASVDAPPLGLGYIAAVLRDNGIDVKMLDCVGRELKWNEIEEELDKLRPKMVGVSVWTPFIRPAMALAKYCKEKFNSIVVIGGPHPMFDLDLLKRPYIDVIVRGEGEFTMLEYMQKGGPEGVKGISYKGADGEIVSNPMREPIRNLDSLPMPARDLFNMDFYIKNFGGGAIGKGTIVVGSRGCPFDCAFCSSSAFWGHSIRARSAKNIVDELEWLKKTYGITGFRPDDDLFIKDKIMALCKELKDRNVNLNWRAQCRVNMVDREMLEAMKNVGCKQIFYGVEAGSQRILDFISKRITKDQVRNAFKLTHDAGMETAAYFIIGHPSETIEEIYETIEFAKEIRPNYCAFSIMSIYPGTRVHELAKERYGFDMKNWEDSFHPEDKCLPDDIHPCSVAYEENFTRAELVELMKYAKKSFYHGVGYRQALNPKVVLRFIASTRSPKDLRVLLTTVRHVFMKIFMPVRRPKV